MAHAKHREYLVIGPPHSGTKWMSGFFQRRMIGVGHEEMGVRGISAWEFAVRGIEPYWARNAGRREDWAFDTVIYTLRDPRKIIRSLCVDFGVGSLKGNTRFSCVWDETQHHVYEQFMRFTADTPYGMAAELVADLHVRCMEQADLVMPPEVAENRLPQRLRERGHRIKAVPFMEDHKLFWNSRAAAKEVREQYPVLDLEQLAQHADSETHAVIEDMCGLWERLVS